MIVFIEEKEHKYFTRDGNNVIYRQRIGFPDAVLGTKVEIPTLYGVEKIDIEKGTQPGDSIKLKGKGIPHLNSYRKGDQVVVIEIKVPEKLSSEEKKLMKKLRESENFKPQNQNKEGFFEKVKGVFS